jgi:aminoglycoside phosphotransferase (APT) family kinase protein
VAVDRPTAEQAVALGGFFRALHVVDTEVAVSRGAPSPEVAWAEPLGRLERFRADVLPRLPERYQRAGAALLGRLTDPPDSPVLVHGDVGPAHILIQSGMVSGVIDWSDAHIGDPAIDLAWLVHGSSRGEPAAKAYGARSAIQERAHDWHRLGPWHEVTYGFDTGRSRFVHSGMAGVLARI